MGKLSTAALPDEAREALTCLFNQIDDLGLRIHVMERRIIAWHRTSEASQRLASAPVVGPITAAALVAAVGDGTPLCSMARTHATRRASGEKERMVGSPRAAIDTCRHC
jgi:transposase